MTAAMQGVLDLAEHYSKDETPAMQARTAALKEVAAHLRTALPTLVESLGLGHLDIRVQPGGRQTSFSPLAWVRVYSRKHSEKATEGFYIVFLFAADGSGVYLSLNQGTSEFRSNAVRPINDRRVLMARAAEARAALVDFADTPVCRDGLVSIDLAWKGLRSVGSESKQRIRNYEDANVFAFHYEAGRLPEDEKLLADLADMLPPLVQLYGVPVRAGAVEAPAPQVEEGRTRAIARKAVARNQGRQLDPEARRAIELYAEDLAGTYFTVRGWSVKPVGHLKLGYDLECRHPDGLVLHAEVKGTQSLGEEVVLTRNEVRHCQDSGRCGAEHVLYVVSRIDLDREDGIRCSGGKEHCVWPWVIDDEDLTPTQYAYRVPSFQRESDSGS
jgi:hypothetical protein